MEDPPYGEDWRIPDPCPDPIGVAHIDDKLVGHIPLSAYNALVRILGANNHSYSWLRDGSIPESARGLIE
jgi:hypothetical protein